MNAVSAPQMGFLDPERVARHLEAAGLDVYYDGQTIRDLQDEQGWRLGLVPMDVNPVDQYAHLALDPQTSGSSSWTLIHEMKRGLDWDSCPPGVGRQYQIRFFRYATNTGDSETLLADIGEVVHESEVDPQYQQVVDDLRSGGRELLASEVIEMLRASREDPDDTDIQLFSLQAMARLLLRHQNFADPVTGPDPYGIMQIEWHITGNGLLVMAFIEGGQVHCVVQADASPQRDRLNVSVQLSEEQAVREFGHLVPLR